MDKDMYDCMSLTTPSSVVDRGIALHKMIRLITLTLGGEHLVLLAMSLCTADVTACFCTLPKVVAASHLQ